MQKPKLLLNRYFASARFWAALSLAILSIGSAAPIVNATGTIGCDQVQTQRG